MLLRAPSGFMGFQAETPRYNLYMLSRLWPCMLHFNPDKEAAGKLCIRGHQQEFQLLAFAVGSSTRETVMMQLRSSSTHIRIQQMHRSCRLSLCHRPSRPPD